MFIYSIYSTIVLAWLFFSRLSAVSKKYTKKHKTYTLQQEVLKSLYSLTRFIFKYLLSKLANLIWIIDKYLSDVKFDN